MEDGSIEKKFIPNYDEKVARLLQNQNRLSLAYGALNDVPYLILEYIAEEVQILDLSYNKFQNLAFLEHFSSLQTLILDKNSSLDSKTFPKMDKLEILWLNNCNLVNITEWLETLQVQCPALKQLSMMCNPVGLTVLNGVSDRDEEEYRKQVIKILPNLEYFDGIKITDRQRKIATQSKPSFALLDEIFRLKMKSFIEISANIHKTFMSADKLNTVMLKNKAIASKNMYT